MKNYKLLVIFIVLFTAISQFSYSQSDSTAKKNINNIIKTTVDKLQQKILLNDNQNTRIEKILSTDINVNYLLKNKEAILNKIEELLNNRQKAKFEIIKEEWWDNFIKLLSD